MRDLEIPIHFNHEVRDPAELQEEQVVIATGAKPHELKLPGIEKSIEACEYLDGSKEVGHRVIIIGGGLTGCEIALDLSLKGKEPVIVEMMQDLMAVSGLSMANSSYLRDYFALHEVEVHLNTKLAEVTDQGAIVESKEGKRFELKSDSVIRAVGYVPDPLAPRSKKIHHVGDCKEVGNLRHVIWGAWDVAMAI